jgi:hypothetical protein
MLKLKELSKVIAFFEVRKSFASKSIMTCTSIYSWHLFLT